MKRWITIGSLVGLSLFLFFLFSSTSADWHEAVAELNSTRAELDSTNTELDSTKTELESTKVELDSTNTALESVQVKLDSTETELESTKVELESTNTELTSTSSSLSATEAELEITRDELAEKETELTDLQVSYEGLLAGHGYTTKDPTYYEMIRFLRVDDTDKAEYIEGEYQCTHFATELCNRAEEKGIRCAYVSLSYPGGTGHAIVAFNTIDKGLTYIEPQFDDLVRVEIGKYFHKCIVPKSGYYYEKPDFDDTIEEVLIAW